MVLLLNQIDEKAGMMNKDSLVDDPRTLQAYTLDGSQPAGRSDHDSSPKMLARKAMLHGPILSTILKLAWPTIVVLLVQTLVGVAEVYYVGRLGMLALAGT